MTSLKGIVRGVALAAAVSWGSTLAFNGTAVAAGGGVAAPDHEWSFEGLFGTYDRAAVRRGLQVYREVCAACHSLNLVAFRHLTQVGYSEEEVKAIAATYQVTDGPNDEGDMFERAGRPADYFPAPFANAKAAAAAMGGAAPPDLSLMTKARFDGHNYLRALMIGYTDPPADAAVQAADIPPGQYYNTYYPSATRLFAMAPPLAEGVVEYPDGTPATVDQMAHDVVTFLAWAAEPEMESRKQMGVSVILFLIVLSGMLFALKRKIWSDVH